MISCPHPQDDKFMKKENLCSPCSLLLRESIPRQTVKKSRVPKEDKGVWGPQSGDRGLEFSRKRKGQTFVFCLHSFKVKVKSLSCVRLFTTPWIVAHQSPPSMGFSRQEYWSGLPFPSPGDLPNPGIKPRSPALEADTLTSEPPGKLKRLALGT